MICVCVSCLKDDADDDDDDVYMCVYIIFTSSPEAAAFGDLRLKISNVVLSFHLS